jgi:hypothetical protein
MPSRRQCSERYHLRPHPPAVSQIWNERRRNHREIHRGYAGQGQWLIYRPHRRRRNSWQLAQCRLLQGFEIKVSRADWINELKDPRKSEATKRYCNRWWLLIASETFVRASELPDDWGLMVAHGTGLRTIKEAPRLEPDAPSVQFITGLMRANKRSHISEDLHAQYIQDNNRRIEAALRKEFADLKQFADFIHEAFGIDLVQDKRWTRDDARPGGGYEKIWVAKLRSKWYTYTSQQLKEMIEVVLSGDFDKVHRELHDAFENAQSALEILDKYKNRHQDHR